MIILQEFWLHRMSLRELKFSSEVIFEIFLLKQRNINQELNDEWQKGVFRGQPLIMGWNFSSFKTLKDNTYTFYCVFDSALNRKLTHTLPHSAGIFNESEQ